MIQCNNPPNFVSLAQILRMLGQQYSVIHAISDMLVEFQVSQVHVRFSHVWFKTSGDAIFCWGYLKAISSSVRVICQSLAISLEIFAICILQDTNISVRRAI
jgi:hypothetical protein